MTKLYSDAGAVSELELLSPNSKYIHAPPENSEKIANKLFASYLGSRPKSYKYTAKVSRSKHNASGLAEAQNHRCCYCHTRFHDHYLSPRYGTFEHVISRKKGGTNHHRNLVMACAICNHTRGGTDMTAEEFYEWVQKNPEKITRLENNFMSKRANQKKWVKKLKEIEKLAH